MHVGRRPHRSVLTSAVLLQDGSAPSNAAPLEGTHKDDLLRSALNIPQKPAGVMCTYGPLKKQGFIQMGCDTHDDSNGNYLVWQCGVICDMEISDVTCTLLLDSWTLNTTRLPDFLFTLVHYSHQSKSSILPFTNELVSCQKCGFQQPKFDRQKVPYVVCCYFLLLQHQFLPAKSTDVQQKFMKKHMCRC